MYEYFNRFLLASNLSSIEFWSAITYILVTVGACFYLLSMAISGLAIRKLSKSESPYRIRTAAMCFSQAIVCIFIVAHFFMPLYSTAKIATTLVMFIFTYIARYFYLSNLSRVFKENNKYQYFYNFIVFGAITLCIIHLIWMAITDTHTCCLGEVAIRNKAHNYILQVQIPFLMNKSFSSFVTFFTLSVSAIYMRFFYLSLKHGDRVMIIGLLFSVVNIFYTTSYHAFGFETWIPLYFLVDLIEYTRLQQLELSEARKLYKSKDQSFHMVLHDIANPIQLSTLKLKSLKRKSKISLKDFNIISKHNRELIEAINKHKNNHQSSAKDSNK